MASHHCLRTSLAKAQIGKPVYRHGQFGAEQQWHISGCVEAEAETRAQADRRAHLAYRQLLLSYNSVHRPVDRLRQISVLSGVDPTLA